MGSQSIDGLVSGVTLQLAWNERRRRRYYGDKIPISSRLLVINRGKPCSFTRNSHTVYNIVLAIMSSVWSLSSRRVNEQASSMYYLCNTDVRDFLPPFQRAILCIALSRATIFALGHVRRRNAVDQPIFSLTDTSLLCNSAILSLSVKIMLRHDVSRINTTLNTWHDVPKKFFFVKNRSPNTTGLNGDRSDVTPSGRQHSVQRSKPST